jgi:hypothetical protein
MTSRAPVLASLDHDSLYFEGDGYALGGRGLRTTYQIDQAVLRRGDNELRAEFSLSSWSTMFRSAAARTGAPRRTPLPTAAARPTRQIRRKRICGFTGEVRHIRYHIGYQ